jgi:DNA-binding helix-hairpin-helix protein with protein kinase domain
MADYKKYAEDLIGNWETDQYKPQKEVLENIYQTNWNRLSNDFSDLKDRLARNFENARLDYRNILNDVQNESFNRMRGANIDLALRGLSSSGVGNLATQADTQLKGSSVDKALADLLANNNASITGYVSGLDTYGNKQTKLANQVEGDLGKITDAEAANAQQYANLVAGLGENAAQRDAANASASAKAAAQRAQEEADDLERRLLILDTLASDELDDNEKAQYLHVYLGVDDINTANAAVKAYNDNKTLKENAKRIEKLNKNIDTANKLNNFYRTVEQKVPILNKINTGFGLLTNNPLSIFPASTINIPEILTNEYIKNRTNKVNDLQKQNNSMTYSDLYDILYGGR